MSDPKSPRKPLANHAASCQEQQEPAEDATVILRDDVLISALAKGVLPLEYREDRLALDLFHWRDDLANAELAWEGCDLEQMGAHLRTSLRARNPASLTLIADELDSTATPIEKDAATRYPRPAAVSASDVAAETDELAVRRKRRLRLSRRVAVGAAVVVIGVSSAGGVAAASVAQPGSLLWPLSKVVDHDRANSLEARQTAQDRLENARKAAQRDPNSARAYLQSALDEADRVRAKDGQDKLRAQAQQLQQQLAVPGASPTAVPPSAPTSSSASPSPSDPSTLPTSATPSPSASISQSPSSSPSASPSGSSSVPSSSGGASSSHPRESNSKS